MDWLSVFWKLWRYIPAQTGISSCWEGLANALQTAKNKRPMDCFFLCGPTLNQADRDNWNIELLGLAVTLRKAKTYKKIRCTVLFTNRDNWDWQLLFEKEESNQERCTFSFTDRDNWNTELPGAGSYSPNSETKQLMHFCLLAQQKITKESHQPRQADEAVLITL